MLLVVYVCFGAPMQYLAIFHGCKNENSQMENCDIFRILALNIDCGYMSQ